MEQETIETIEKILGIKFKYKKNLQKAFIHSSYANHYKKKSNERLEYLGDSILDFVTADYLYNYTSLNEGDLSKIRAKLVSKENLSRVIEDLGLQKYIKYYPENKNNFSKKEMCDLFESLVAVVYIDSGFEAAKEFATKHIPLNSKAVKQINESLKDYKSTLQELVQENHILPVYKVLKEMGPDHDKTFEVGVFLQKALIAKGVGDTKKSAENLAAKNALNILNNRTNERK